MFPTLCQVEFLSRPSNETKFEKIVLSHNHNDSDASGLLPVRWTRC
jgi:hypothetical protein